METKSLKASWIIMLFVHCVLIILSLIVLIAPTFFISSEFLSYTGQKWADFSASNSEVASFFIFQIYEIGVIGFGWGVILVLMTVLAYRKGVKWTWPLLLISNTLGWGGLICVDLPTRDMGVVMMAALLFIIAYVGLFIGAKTILKKSTN